MQYIGKSKIGKQYSKPTITYPIIRLPLQCSEVIGTSVQIYELENAGQTIFVIIPDNEKSENVGQEVAQPNAKVVQPNHENDIESRLSALEPKIDETLKLIFSNQNQIELKREKNSGLGAIRTPDLRHVKARIFAIS